LICLIAALRRRRYIGLMIWDFANPTRFMGYSGRLLPWLCGAAALVLGIGLVMAWGAPADYQQGDTVRIMFLHVPAAWLSLFFYTMMSVSALGTLVWRHPLADVSQKAAAPIGAAFTFICLVTGSLWGKPMWGTYWVWDARLTSFLVLFFLYVGHIALTHAFDDRQRGRRSAAIIAVVGIINLPIIKYSVDWWNTLHQSESILRMGGPTIDPAMLWPLFIMIVAFTLYFFAVVMTRMKAMLLEARHRAAAFAR
jgi:heme exporter protein C